MKVLSRIALFNLIIFSQYSWSNNKVNEKKIDQSELLSLQSSGVVSKVRFGETFNATSDLERDLRVLLTPSQSIAFGTTTKVSSSKPISITIVGGGESGIEAVKNCQQMAETALYDNQSHFSVKINPLNRYKVVFTAEEWAKLTINEMKSMSKIEIEKKFAEIKGQLNKSKKWSNVNERNKWQSQKTQELNTALKSIENKFHQLVSEYKKGDEVIRNHVYVSVKNVVCELE